MMLEADEGRAAVARRLASDSKYKIRCPRCKSDFTPYWPKGYNNGGKAKPPVGPLGTLLRSWRQELAISSKQAAARCNISQSLWEKIERGLVSRLKISTLKNMHRAGVRDAEGTTIITLIKRGKITPHDIFFMMDHKITTLADVSKMFGIKQGTIRSRMYALNIQCGAPFDPALIRGA